MYSDAELIEFCEEQVQLQRQKMEAAQRVVTIYATEQVQGATIGPDREEAAMRGEYANKFWCLAQRLRAESPEQEEGNA